MANSEDALCHKNKSYGGGKGDLQEHISWPLPEAVCGWFLGAVDVRCHM